jgi:hypothetical protein
VAVSSHQYSLTYIESTSTMSRQAALLRSIQQTSASLLKALPRSDSLAHTPPNPPALDCSLPAPSPITTRLTAVGLEKHIAEQLSSSYTKFAYKFKDVCEAKLREMCQAHASLTSSREEAAYWHKRISVVATQQYNSWTQQWTEDTISHARSYLAKTRRRSQVVRKNQEKAPFNQVKVLHC